MSGCTVVAMAHVRVLLYMKVPGPCYLTCTFLCRLGLFSCTTEDPRLRGEASNKANNIFNGL